MEILVVLMLVFVALATVLISPISDLYLSKEQVEKLLDISYILVLFLVILDIYIYIIHSPDFRYNFPLYPP